MILIIFSYDGVSLHYGVSHGDASVQRLAYHVVKLESGLLGLIERIERDHGDFRGILVCNDQLGGFAGTRLLISTLNTIAWSRNIPIVGQKASVQQETLKNINGFFKKRKNFMNPMTPAYNRNANITQSKRTRKFTIR